MKDRKGENMKDKQTQKCISSVKERKEDFDFVNIKLIFRANLLLLIMLDDSGTGSLLISSEAVVL